MTVNPMRKIPRLPKPAALALVTSSLFVSLAQTQTLQEVVVTPTSEQQPISQAIAATALITRDDLAASQVRDLPSALRVFAGIDMGQSGIPGSQTSVFLRGGEGRNTLVLVDGVPITRGDFGTSSVQNISADQIERLEIVRGNVSAIYGSSAVGGVVQVFTRKPTQAEFGMELGSRGNYKLSAGGGTKTESSQLSVFATMQRAGGFSAKDTSVVPTANPDADRSDNHSLVLSGAHEWSAGQRLSALLSLGNTDTEYDGSSLADDRLKAKNQLFSWSSDNRINNHWSSKLSVSQARERFDDATGFLSFGVNRNTRLSWDNRFQVAADHKLTFGLEHARTQFEDSAATPYELRRVKALRLGYEGKAGALSWQANARHDDTSDFGSASTYYVGLGWALTPQWKLLGSASTAFNAPRFVDLAFHDPTQPALRAERAQSQELGLQYAGDKLLARATLFNARQRNRIEFDPVTFVAGNTGLAKNKGLELAINAEAGPGTLGLDATFQDPVNATSGERLKRRARTSVALNYSLSVGPTQWGAYLKYTGKRLDTDPNTFGDAINTARTQLDLTTQYKLSKETALYARVENVSNTRRNEVLGFNTAPRGFFVGVRHTPNL